MGEQEPLLPKTPQQLEVSVNADKAEEKSDLPPLKVYYEVFFVVMPLFSGYACLFSLQRHVKEVYGISDDGSENSYLFGIAASFVYLGNLIFRLGHNFFFFFLFPRTRVVVSIVAMACSMGTIVLIFLHPSPALWWVFIAYAFGGMSIGTFESNVLSSVAVLGKSTKLCALLGIPTGITTITVGGFILLEVGVHPVWIYLGVLAFLVVGLALFLVRVYRDAGTANFVMLTHFLGQLLGWREWLPVIKFHAPALMADMFFVSLFSPGVLLYLYDQDTVPMPGGHTVPTDYLFAVYNACFFLGDALSRRLLFPVRVVVPFVFLILSVLGAVCGLSGQAFLAPLCALGVSFANGSIYAQANKQIDSHVPPAFSLIAFSFWLFLGDVGSVMGSNLISYINVDIRKLYH